MSALAAVLRACSLRVGKAIAILLDLQGPKIRTGKIQGGKVQLLNGAQIVLTNRANAYLAKGDLDAALADYNEAIRIVPNYIRAHAGRGGEESADLIGNGPCHGRHRRDELRCMRPARGQHALWQFAGVIGCNAI